MEESFERNGSRCGVRSPEFGHCVAKNSDAKGSRSASNEPEFMSVFVFPDQAEFCKGRLQGILVTRFPSWRLGYVRPYEARHIAPDGRLGSTTPFSFTDKFGNASYKSVAVKRNCWIVIKRPIPGCLLGGSTAQLPVNQPGGGWTLHIRVETIIIKQHSTEWSRLGTPRPILDNSCGIRPVPYGCHHVLADPEPCNCIFCREDRHDVILVLGGLDGIKSFLEPAVPQWKRLVPSKPWLIALLEEGAPIHSLVSQDSCLILLVLRTTHDLTKPVADRSNLTTHLSCST